MPKNKIPFNQPTMVGGELRYITQAVKSGWIGGDGFFTRKCNEWLEKNLKAQKVLLTNSCTAALEIAAMLCDLKPGDEVILPSFTFVSTANAFALRGAKLIFVDIRPDTLNIDESLIPAAVTKRTKVIVPVHYAGVACAMKEIKNIAAKHKLFVIEDAAQGVLSAYQRKALGTLGDFGAYSFHETKNYTCGEGGAMAVNNPKYIKRAEIIIEKGTNRKEFYRGNVDKYTWVDLGSSYLPSDIVAAFLFGQLEKARAITAKRLAIWRRYHVGLLPLMKEGRVKLPTIPKDCRHNGHMFYLLAESARDCRQLSQYLKSKGVASVFHYVPLHQSPMAQKLGINRVKLPVTESAAERLLRLPLYYELKAADQDRVVDLIHEYFNRQ